MGRSVWFWEIIEGSCESYFRVNGECRMFRVLLDKEMMKRGTILYLGNVCSPGVLCTHLTSSKQEPRWFSDFFILSFFPSLLSESCIKFSNDPPTFLLDSTTWWLNQLTRKNSLYKVQDILKGLFFYSFLLSCVPFSCMDSCSMGRLSFSAEYERGYYQLESTGCT